MAEPGKVIVGEWAHVRYHDRQHLVVANEPDVDTAEPVRFACGKRTFTRAVWHGAPTPHLLHCRACLRSSK